MTKDTRFSNWQPCKTPGETNLVGVSSCLEPYSDADHLTGLFEAVAGPGNDDIWQYMPLGPFENSEAFAQALAYTRQHIGWKTMVIKCTATQTIRGMASYMRLRPEHGSVEVGCIAFGKKLKRTFAATEAMFLMMCHVFDDLGYRRYEWKCNNANDASKNAAVRFGFVFEGVFRNDMIVHGASRDTAWYSITDDEWPAVKAMFQAWLKPENFDQHGNQLQKLSTFKVSEY
ncbi:GNAT family N-acetyltransferase [Kordiimonas aquimaris]|uniref:GNAT family N-acetyltransferase n=1 Tax=Kordiimonas aquimaris TaxID=707591 RepID=UPI0021D198E2|nr:GNAT family protein [Kordiimonas aquimaris]